MGRSPKLACLTAALLVTGGAAALSFAVDRLPGPEVTATQGTVRGIVDGDIHIFKGIPFAAAPVGSLRWRAPQPAPAWRGVRDAREFGPACPQPLRPGSNAEDLAGRAMSEDCLHLNIWTQTTNPAAKRPVMVWILPGGFTRGDGGMSRYDGAALARRGVVLVTFNYRLGIFGVFAHPAMSRAQANEPLGNYNLMDQLAALRWVRANVAAFGGDPNNVTIFGMSAGGMSVNYLMASPAAAGLFHKAISQSSALRMSSDRSLREDHPDMPSLESEGARHASTLGIAADDANLLVKLRKIPMRALLDYQAKNPIGAAGGLTAVIDGQILPAPVGKIFREGRQNKLPYLTGATDWEGSLVKGEPESLAPVLKVLNVTPAEAKAVYRESDPVKLAWTIYSDFFLSSQRYLAAAHAAQGQRTWVYRFSRVLESHQSDYFGASHGAETRYVFETLDRLTTVAGPDRPGDMGYRVTAADRAYADVVARYWVNFATYGDPNSDGLPGWPALSPGNDLLLEFAATEPRLRRDLLADRWKFFKTHFDSGRL